MIAWSGTKYNWLSHEQKQERDHLIAQAREDGNEALAQEVEEYYQKLDEDQERVREHLEIPENESYSPEMETAIINSNQTIHDLRERDNGYIVTVEALRLAKRQGLTEYKFGDEDFITLSGSIGSGLGVSGGFIMDRTGNIYYTRMPMSAHLTERWNAFVAGGAACSEMESSALFILSSLYRKRAGAVMLVINEADLAETEEVGTDKHMLEFDADRVIQVAVEALKILIEADRQ